MPSEHELSDNELGRHARSGSLSAFEELVRRYEARIYSFAMAQLRSTADAQEATQETFVKAWQSLKSWDIERSFPNWLFAIARNSCADSRRRKARVTEELNPEEFVDRADPSEILASSEEAANLWSAAQRLLPGSQFTAVWLRYAEGMSVADIASVLGVSKASAKILLFRARFALAGHPAFKRQARPLSPVARTGLSQPQPESLKVT